MDLKKEFTFTGEHINYEFQGIYDIYILEGTCSFQDSKLYDVAGTVYVNMNSDGHEEKAMIGTFNYNSYVEDRASYSFYIDFEYETRFTSVLVDIINEIRKGK